MWVPLNVLIVPALRRQRRVSSNWSELMSQILWLYHIFDRCVFCIKTHGDDPNVRNKCLVNLSLKTSKYIRGRNKKYSCFFSSLPKHQHLVAALCLLVWQLQRCIWIININYFLLVFIALHAHHIQDGVEQQLQRYLCGLPVVFNRAGHGEQLVVSGQVQVVQNILVTALSRRLLAMRG